MTSKFETRYNVSSEFHGDRKDTSETMLDQGANIDKTEDSGIDETDFTKSGLFASITQKDTTREGISETVSSFLEGFESGTEDRGLFASPRPKLKPTDHLRDQTEDGYAIERDTVEPELGGKYSANLSDGRRIILNPRTQPAEVANTLDRERDYYGVNIHDLLIKVEAQEKIDQYTKDSKVQNAVHLPEKLLAEKFRPRRWIDLLGSEKTHRSLMNWLIKWKKVASTEPDLSIISDPSFNTDALGRPFKKILLIHGPPGIGKTTVAHVVAKQAGYDIMEINASDERSREIVERRIGNAMAMHRIGSDGNDNKPVCVVADEIEGAAENGFIKALVDMIQADQQALASITSGKKKKKGRLMLRPIIAICNDVYTASLRQLRPHAEIISYSRSDTRQVIKRLQDICSKERLKMSTKQLTTIANLANGDLRTCLNMIQFGLQEGDELFQKDINRSWSKVANRVFKQPDRGTAVVDEWNDLVTEIDGSGEHDKVLNGCFSLYPLMRYTDDMVRKPGKIGEWLDFYENINHGIYQKQQGSLGEYLTYPLVAFNNLFSSTANVKDHRVENDGYEMLEQQRATKALLKDYFSELQPGLRQIFNKDEALMEMIPRLVSICSPNIESSSINLRTQEKSRISNAAGALLDSGIHLVKEKLDSGSVVFRYDPPLENLAIVRESNDRDQVAVGRYAVRTMIQDEIVQRRGIGKRKFDFERESTNKHVKKKQKAGIKILTQNLAPSGPRDFFGREIAHTETSTQIEKKHQDHSERVWVQYVEGFSNAVRKDMTWVDLFLRE